MEHGEASRTSTATLLGLIALAVLGPVSVCAQSDRPGDDSRNDSSADEELVVRGQRLSDFRSELEMARVRVYDLFNDLNSDDAFDVHCQHEAATGTRMRQHICRPQFKDDISNAAAKAWVYGIKDHCTDGLTQNCIFSRSAQHAMSRAQAEESWEGPMQQRFEAEFERVLLESPELQQAILDYEALERAYDEARGGRRARVCARPSPPPRCSR